VPHVASVLTVDDEPRVRTALRLLVEATWEHAVVAEAESGEAAVAAVRERPPEIVLMDVRMPGAGGTVAADAIKRMHPATLVLLVSATDPDELSDDPTRSLADDFLCKGRLRPALLAETWAKHRGRLGQMAD
jgi:DNA-binding NarL/FixJ family response regulator